MPLLVGRRDGVGGIQVGAWRRKREAPGLLSLVPRGDLPDPAPKRMARRKGWGLLGCFEVGVLVAGVQYSTRIG